MKTSVLVMASVGLAGLVACGAVDDTSTPSEPLVEREQPKEMIQKNIEALRQVQSAVQRGELPPLVDVNDQLIDLDAELHTLELLLDDPDLALHAISEANEVQAQAAATATVYQNIVSVSLDTFNNKLATYKKTYPGFSWSTDGCTMPLPGQYLGFKARFYQSCRHHDFGYHNVRLYPQLRNEFFRLQVDVVFLRDLNSQCVASDVTCKAAAAAFYSAVRIGGLNSPFYNW